MMIRKELRLVITFATTTEAIAMERFCRDNGVPGRLIPVPPSITAGCGMAWSAPVKNREMIDTLMKENNIEKEAMHMCMV